MSRTIGVLTTGRQDWGILRSTCLALREDSAFALRLLVGGMHLSDAFGRTAFEIEADGFKADAALPWIDENASTSAIEQAGRALESVGQALEQLRPHALLLVGDRFETAAAAIAATLSRIPIVHLHGGEETTGAVDNALRHAITQMAQLHLVSHEAHRNRVISMGIDPKTVHVVGAPGLDNLRRSDLATPEELSQKLGVELSHPLVVVTLHPSTASAIPGEVEVAALSEAMDAVPATFVITLPNSDSGHTLIREALVRAARKPGRVAVEALGSRGYWGLLSVADAMLGNSSSAIIEGSALGLPAVNIGDRQQGRLRGNNVIDAPVDADAIKSALRHALDPATRRACQDSSPFGNGRSAESILDILRRWTPPFGRNVAVDPGGR